VSEAHPHAGRVVLLWATGNAVLAIGLFAFVSHEPERPLYWCSVTLLVISAAVFGAGWGRTRRRARERTVPPPDRSGGPSLAFAAACLAGGFAWVFGVWVAYLALVPMTYCVTKLRAERIAARRGSPS
jgi:uncharacterized membrane protein YfcA